MPVKSQQGPVTTNSSSVGLTDWILFLCVCRELPSTVIGHELEPTWLPQVHSKHHRPRRGNEQLARWDRFRAPRSWATIWRWWSVLIRRDHRIQNHWKLSLKSMVKSTWSIDFSRSNSMNFDLSLFRNEHRWSVESTWFVPHTHSISHRNSARSNLWDDFWRAEEKDSAEK